MAVYERSNLFHITNIKCDDIDEFNHIVWRNYNYDANKITNIINNKQLLIKVLKKNPNSFLSCLDYLQFEDLKYIISIFVENVIVKCYNRNYWKLKKLNYNLRNLCREQCCINNNTDACNTQKDTIERGHLYCLIYFIEVQHQSCITNAINCALNNGYLHVVKYLHEVQ